jgi:hypothetical protein
VSSHHGSLPISWRIKEPFSIRARQQGSLLQPLARAYRLWSMRLTRPQKQRDEELETYCHPTARTPSKVESRKARALLGRRQLKFDGEALQYLHNPSL